MAWLRGEKQTAVEPPRDEECEHREHEQDEREAAAARRINALAELARQLQRNSDKKASS